MIDTTQQEQAGRLRNVQSTLENAKTKLTAGMLTWIGTDRSKAAWLSALAQPMSLARAQELLDEADRMLR